MTMRPGYPPLPQHMAPVPAAGAQRRTDRDRLPWLLGSYIARNFTIWFFVLLIVMLGVVMMFDTVELLRRAANKPQATFRIVLTMAAYKLPDVGQQITPFVVLFAGMMTLWRMTRSQELVVARSAGISVWQFLSITVAAVVLLGAVQTTVISPLGAAMIARYEALEARYLLGRPSTLDISAGGLWLRQQDGEGQALIHAASVDRKTFTLKDVTVVLMNDDDEYTGRLDAPDAVLTPATAEKRAYWLFRTGWLHRPGQRPEQATNLSIFTDLTPDRIEESFANPETLSFWELPRFIATLEATGFSALRHRIYYQSLLSLPLFFAAMLTVAAAFSLRHSRRGGALMLVAAGISSGLVVFLCRNVILAFGSSGALPVWMAAWSPGLIALAVGLALLLHLEDS